MNNSPFIITDAVNKKYTVSWPTFRDIREVEVKIKLLDVLFNDLKLFDVGLAIKFNQEEMDVMWINQFAFLGHPEIDQFMQDHYDIVGVVFEKQFDAEKFKDWLEKKYIWKLLNE